MEFDVTVLRNEAEKNLFYAQEQIAAAGFVPSVRLTSLDDVPVKRGGKLCLGMECLDRALWELKPALENLSKLGVYSARLQTGWARTETQKGVYDFSALDQEVESLRAIGIQPWLSLSYGNPIYFTGDESVLRAGGVGHVPIHGEEERQAWVNYVEATVSRYRGRIVRYEIWNEPDVKVFFPEEADWVASYLELVRLTAPVIRKADPDAIIIACTGRFQGLKPLLDGGLGDYVDQYSFHNYSAFPDEQTISLREALRTLRDRCAPHLKLIRGEAGCPSYNAPTSFGALHDMKTSETIQAKWAGRHLIPDFADPMLIETSYFHAYEFLHFSRMHQYYYGALRQDYSRKPVYDVLQVLTHLFDGDTKADAGLCMTVTKAGDGLAPQDCLLVRSCAFERKGMPLLAYWRSEEIQDQSPVTVMQARFFPAVCWKHPVVLDTLTRVVYEVQPDEQGGIALPLTGHALVLTEAQALEGLIRPEAMADLTEAQNRTLDTKVEQYEEG